MRERSVTTLVATHYPELKVWAHTTAGATNASVSGVFGADPWGIPSIYPSALVSIAMLVLVSLLTPRPKPEELEKLFPGSK
jgi:hypothetical protein